MTFVPILVSVCKKKTKFVYDENRKIIEKNVLPLNFTIDIRYMNTKTAKNFYEDVEKIFIL